MAPRKRKRVPGGLKTLALTSIRRSPLERCFFPLGCREDRVFVFGLNASLSSSLAAAAASFSSASVLLPLVSPPRGRARWRPAVIGAPASVEAKYGTPTIDDDD